MAAQHEIDRVTNRIRCNQATVKSVTFVRTLRTIRDVLPTRRVGATGTAGLMAMTTRVLLPHSLAEMTVWSRFGRGRG
ncbi:MAG: hypothetical protein KDA91_24240 [Planctomycetaceae bacterium]|nr:hypothetical protein [Planctomycetaceae bacterium]